MAANGVKPSLDMKRIKEMEYIFQLHPVQFHVVCCAIDQWSFKELKTQFKLDQVDIEESIYYYTHMMPAGAENRSVNIHPNTDNIMGFQLFDKDGALLWKIG